MATRLALLIGAPGGGKHSKFLPGVLTDITKTREFLMSKHGGAWHDNEIITLYNPTLTEVSDAKKYMYADYTITLFSGHGFSNSEGQRFLSLTNGDSFQDTELLNNSPKQLALIDSCRKIVSTGLSAAEYGDPWLHFDGDYENVARARKAYDKWIELSKPGRLILHSTNHDTYSYDTIDGGVFTQKLLQVGYNVPVKDKFNFFNIISTGKFVPKMILEEGYNQKPSITYKSGDINLPFALALPTQRYPTRKITKKQPNYTPLLLGLGIAGLFFLTNNE